MPRTATVRFDAKTQSWRSDVGPVGNNGRRMSEYFKEIPNTARGRKLAEAALAAYLVERDAREAEAKRDPDPLAVYEVVGRYLAHSAACRHPRTAATHAERLSRWMQESPGAVEIPGPPSRWIDPRPASDLIAGSLRGFARTLLEAGKSASYVAGIMASVKACWAWAAEHDDERSPPRLVLSDVFASVAPPEIPQAPERYVPPDQAMALLAWIDARAAGINGLTGELERLTALMYRTLYESGARPDELCRARWRDLDAAVGVLTLRRHKTVGKVRRPRRVPLTRPILAALLAARARPGRHEEFLFTHKRGRGAGRDRKDRSGVPWRPGPLGQKFLKLRRRAAAEGVDIRVRDGNGYVPEENPECTLMDFRRSFSSDSGESGHRDEDTAAAMGNSAAMVSRVYSTRQSRAVVMLAEAVAATRRSAAGGVGGGEDGGDLLNPA